MKTKNLYSLFILFLLTVATFAQTTITLQPDAATGKDTEIFDCVPCGYNTLNFGSKEDFDAIAWTNSGDDVTVRSMIEFDISTIPANSVINDARLTLYHNPTSIEGEHSTLSGSNSALLRRIITSWGENTVVWNTQPFATTNNQVVLPQSSSPIQDYIDIDVTALVQDMMDDPANSFGFMLRLQDETSYRRLIFASSDNLNNSKHPKLVITYTSTIGIFENGNIAHEISTYPNPFNDATTVEFGSLANENVILTIYNLAGQAVRTIGNITAGEVQIERGDLEAGSYIFHISQEGSIVGSGKLMIGE